MAKVDLKYNATKHKTDVLVSNKRTIKVIGSFESSTEALETAKFLLKVFHDIAMDTLKEIEDANIIPKPSMVRGRKRKVGK